MTLWFPLLRLQEFEQQATALLKNSVHGFFRLPYIINVNYMSYIYLTAVDMDSSSDDLQLFLEDKRYMYERSIEAALDKIGVLKPLSNVEAYHWQD
ncbi:hypothetical protein SLS56_004972 [Neofusicoccum ribis]|uniref:Uncharacterized protein n=1 Tax=Neofusicoccum ribis TaxID=45134 RepID=A0ABR3SUP4_9PEZI